MFNMLGKAIKPIAAKTEVAGTDIHSLVPPLDSADVAVVTRLSILNGITAQTLTVMRPSGRTYTSALAAAAQKVIDINSDPGSIAANDLLAIELASGLYQVVTVASVAVLEITLVEDLAAIVNSNAKVFFFGVAADGHEQLAIGASAETNYESEVGYFIANEPGYPILFNLSNATNAATIQGGTIVYAQA
jgi:hypothetical protein